MTLATPSSPEPLPRPAIPEPRALGGPVTVIDTSTQSLARLMVQRLHSSDWTPSLRARALGGMGYGLDGDDDGLAGLPVPVLEPSQPCIDAWIASGPLRSGRQGAVRWRHDGHWLYGALDIADAEADLAEVTRLAYRDVFDTLKATGFAHLQRVWNYLPRINNANDGLERYRRFNIGRQQAFIDTDHNAFEGAPAACALGTGAGSLRLRFLAGVQAPVPVENPRQVSAYRYPQSYGPRSPSFSRAAVANAGAGRVALFVSGTASIVGHSTQHAGDVQAQTRETLTNLRTVIAAAQAHSSAPLSLPELVCCVYVRHAEDRAAVQAVLDADWGCDSLAARQAVYLQADICRADLLVEVEGHLITEGSIKA